MSVTAERPVPDAGSSPSWRARAADLAELGRTTRVGQLARATLVALLLVVLTGVLALVAALRTGAAADDVVTRSGPLTASAQELYRALSDADTSAGQGFLLGADEPAALRLRYQTDLAAAGRALAVLGSASTGTGADATAVTTLAQGIPAYTGLVETARAVDRQGLTYGSAYLREASSFLRTDLLPAAQQIYDLQSAALADAQDGVEGGVWAVLALVAGIAALVALRRLHRRIAHTTRRRRTPGVVLAGGALALLVVWGVLALGLSALSTATARDDGTAPNRELVAARFAVLQSRSDEILTLVARSTGGSYEQDYVRRSIVLYGWQGLLDRARTAAGDGAVADDATTAQDAGRRGIVVHELVRTLDVSGQYDQAVALALSAGADGGQGAVTEVLDALDRGVAGTADTTARSASTARAATVLLPLGVVVLTLVAAGGLVAGVWPRLQEYR
ncbi:hypothetical protein [Actinomycetospora sp. NBRC 106378]|uniref:hypothetical protein n=1 Tax=Actinomycetospora sp. NBRC 106378 TaxID=3032208 RepID=UPI0024A3BA0E|nr:hypothetical protein [Actinomycetospora sp. NBRC 106378]GLZ52032.1 hypothetical protein Acsp07_16490 [Actinomycetospora sp. NBRC 106378]